MEKEFVPYELALQLKELGFDKSTFGGWCHPFNNRKPYLQLNQECDYDISAPTFSQAFRWFREKYKLHSYISLGISDEQDISGLEYDEYIYVIEGLNGLDYNNYSESLFYKTPEEVELECLKKLIEIVKSK